MDTTHHGRAESQWIYSRQRLGEDIGQKKPPNAILLVSPHRLTRKFFVTLNERPEPIHDFGGFPQELIQMQCPAPDSPVYARQAMELVPDLYGSDEWASAPGWCCTTYFRLPMCPFFS